MTWPSSHPSRLTFLLGAGVSSQYEIPVMPVFFDELMSFLRTRYESAATLANELTQGKPDLEVLIERVERIVGTAQVLPNLNSPDPAPLQARIADANQLRSYIRAFIVDRCERFNADRAINELGPLLAVSQHCGLTLFTTNYDRIIEHCCQQQNVRYVDGFASANGPVARWDGQFDCPLCLFKLHGSVNWFTDGTEQVRLDRGFPLPSHEFKITWQGRILEARMVIPALLKETLEEPYSSLGVSFNDATASCGLLIVAGSSLRDSHLTSVIATRLEQDSLVVLLIDPAIPTAAPNLRRLERVAHISSTFQAFLQAALADLPALQTAIIASANATEAYQKLSAFADQTEGQIRREATLSPEASEALNSLRRGAAIDRVAAASALRGQNPAEPILEALLAALRDPDPSVRAAAASAASNYNEPRIAPLLAENIKSATTLAEKLETALALRRMTVPEAAQAVQQLISEPRSIEDSVFAALTRGPSLSAHPSADLRRSPQ